jgi:hypothetical protein
MAKRLKNGRQQWGIIKKYIKIRKEINMCDYCNEDRLINQGKIWFGKIGTIACINNKNELVVNIKGEQANIPIRVCPWCGSPLSDNYKPTPVI